MNNHRPTSSQVTSSIYYLGLFAILLITVGSGCSTTSIHPTYRTAIQSAAVGGDRAIRITATERLNHSAPLATQLSAAERVGVALIFTPALGVSHVMANGQAMISERGPYKLDDSVSATIATFLAEGLIKRGYRAEKRAPGDPEPTSGVEIEAQRFEFIMASGGQREDRGINVAGNVLCLVRFRQEMSPPIEILLVEQGARNFGAAMTPKELGGFVSELLSKAVDNLLGDPRVVAAVKQLSASPGSDR